MTKSKLSRQGKLQIVFTSSSVAAILFFYNNCARQYDIQFNEPTSVSGASVPNEEIAPGPTGSTQAKTTMFTADDLASKVDILFVVDNSPSMGFEQKSLASKFSNFIHRLDSRNLDWQLSVITTDGTADGNLEGGFVDEDLDGVDGQFLKFRKFKAITNSFEFSNFYTLNSTMDPIAVQKYFGDTVQRKPNPNAGYEQALYSVYRAIERAKMNGNRNRPNKNFFRPGAALSVVVLSDSDETPLNDQPVIAVVDGKTALHAGVVDNNISGVGVGSTHVSLAPNATKIDFLKYIAQTFPNKHFKFHSIIVRENDFACKNNNTSYFDNQILYKNLNEDFGKLYATVSKSTGGHIGDICASDYGSQLTNLGDSVSNQVKSVTLDCVPLDMNGDGKADIQIVNEASGADIALESKVVGTSVILNSALPPGTYSVKYKCNL